MIDYSTNSAVPGPGRGRLTFDVEGQEGGPYHSRRLHVPSSASGLTIGRGYDMKHRTKSMIRNELLKAGVAAEKANLISQAAGLKGDQAEEFIEENDLEGFEISAEQQVDLFEIEYALKENDTRRLATKDDVTAVYGATDWDALDQMIREILVDLRFRGYYTPTTRRFLQVCVSENDLRKFTDEIGERNNWPNVPPDRFKRRKDFCDTAMAKLA